MPPRYYAPQAKPVLQSQPTEMPGEATWQEAVQADNDPLRRQMPGYSRTDQLSLLFETSLKSAPSPNAVHRRMQTLNPCWFVGKNQLFRIRHSGRRGGTVGFCSPAT